MNPDFRALCAELSFIWNRSTNPDDLFINVLPLVDRIRAALAQPEPVGPEPGYEKGYAQEHLARLMRDAIGTETNHNAYILAAGKILDRPEFAHVARWGTPNPITEELT